MSSHVPAGGSVEPYTSSGRPAHLGLHPNGHEHGHVHGHGHDVQFYEDDAFLVEEVSSLIGAALGAGDAGIIIATEANRCRIEERLAARGVDLDLASVQGWYVSLDAAEALSWFMVHGSLDAQRFRDIVGEIITRATAAAEHPRAMVFGEMVALLLAEGQAETAIQLEQLWNDLARTQRFELRCAYPMSLFRQSHDAEAFRRICAEHSRVIPAESYTTLIDDDYRQRAITVLQQKAQALETEILEREAAQQALQRREAELTDFLENALEGVQQVGADQTVGWANKALLELLGYAPEEYIGQPLSQFHTDQRVFAEYWQRLTQGEDIYDFPADLRCKDGSVRHVLIHSNAVRQDGQFVRTRCFIRDITEQKQMEQTLRERNQQLQQAITVRDEFLSIAAHELKTPITSLRAFAQLLRRSARRNREIAPERLETALEAIEQQSGKLNHLVTRLFETTQIAAGRRHIEPVRTDLAALVRSAIAQRQGDSRHTIIVEGPEQLQALVDPDGMEQVISNLLDNAVKFSPEGGTITVTFSRNDMGRVQLVVSDEGIGVPLTQREDVFERFHHAHGQGHLSGLGLGLYITREIVEMHGGSVHIEEYAHRGSRFVIVLPQTPGTLPGTAT